MVKWLSGTWNFRVKPWREFALEGAGRVLGQGIEAPDFKSAVMGSETPSDFFFCSDPQQI